MEQTFEENISLQTGEEYQLATHRGERVIYLGKENRLQSHLFLVGERTTDERTQVIYIPESHCTVNERRVADGTYQYTTLTLASLPNRTDIMTLIDYAQELRALNQEATT